MKMALGTALLLFTSALASEAKLILAHSMDWYTASAQDVVLCTEQKVEFKKIEHHPPESSQAWTETRTEATCKVLRVFKGDLQPGAILHVDYDMGFYRVFPGGEGCTAENPGQPARVIQPQYLPAGRALLFLLKRQKEPSYGVVTAKLIQNGRVYQYLQAMDPGPLELFPQQPENSKRVKALKEGESETEDELIQDEVIAVKKVSEVGSNLLKINK